jgi:excisionase family DNA binding protein
MRNGYFEGNIGTDPGPVRVKGGSNETVVRDKLLTPDEVAVLMDVKMSWVMDHVTRVEPIIPHIRLGKMIRFKREAVLAWLDSYSTTKPTWERSGDED